MTTNGLENKSEAASRAWRLAGVACVIVLLFLWIAGVLLWEKEHRAVAEQPARSENSSPPNAFEPGEPPRLLTPRVATAQEPALAWERLLAADGSPREDLGALADLVGLYLQSGVRDRRAIGFNEDLIITLTDPSVLGDAALPKDHPAIRDGRLLDRWGTPWQVHPLANDVIELRSAGQDRRLYTADDLVKPER